MSILSKFTVRNSIWTTDIASGIQVLQVQDQHALLQAVGYLKHIHGSDDGEAVYFRGQSRLYSGMPPTLFRGCLHSGPQSRRIGALKRYIERYRATSSMLGSYSTAICEPILQHYGIKTSWVDLVDNVWIALWFACHTAKTTGTTDEFLNMERRDLSLTTTGKYAYILLVGVDTLQSKQISPGHVRGKKCDFIDLRVAAPSIFLRPHSQHGVLFRLRGNQKHRPLDYGSAIRGIIRIRLRDALRWLGDGSLLSTHHLFPPPTYDEGYRMLLVDQPPGDKTVGAISMVGC